MLVSFNKLSSDSKIWIYQSSKKLDQLEKDIILKQTESFLVEWTAHGQSLQAAMQILYDQFLVIGVNEAVNEASGCSIDKSVNHVRELEQSLNINLLDRSKIAIQKNNQVELIDFSEIKRRVADGTISSDTKIFNNAIVSKGELESSWLKPAADSWIKRHF